MSRDHHSGFASQANGSNLRNKTLPPIREVFADELGTPVWAGENQRSQRSLTPFGQYLIPFRDGRKAPTMTTAVQQPSYSSVGHSSRSEYVGRGVSAPEEYSYGVLRASGTSGLLTNAIPPSGRPKGILRQTSTTSNEPEDMTKRHKCEYCGKRFGMPSHLQIHLRTHTAQRPFICEYSGCDKTFTVRSNLNRHMRTHGKSSHMAKEDEEFIGGGHVYPNNHSQQSGSSSNDRSYYSSARR